MTGDQTVQSSWARILRWLQANAPATADALRPPAPAEELASTMARTGVTWPDELLTWFSLHDGWERDAWPMIFPGWPSPMSLSRCLENWQVEQEIWRDIAADDEDSAERLDQGRLDAAGEFAGVYLPAFVPLDEDQGGDVLVVDCRPGPRNGCVTHWKKHDGDSDGRGWWSIAELLTDVADHLEDGTPCRSWRPQVENGSLSWDLDFSPGPVSRCLARGPQE